jgi:hypothetical protein
MKHRSRYRPARAPNGVSRLAAGLLGVSALGFGACDSGRLSGSLEESANIGGGVDAPAEQEVSPGANAGGNTDETPPEAEREASYQAPVVTGPYVWTANPSSGRVAVIDSNTFEIRSGQAGNQPSVIVGLELPTGAQRACWR